MDRLAGGRSQRPGGAAGAHSAHKAWAGTFGPRPCFGFAGPLGPQNAAAPRRDPTSPPSPSPARLRQPYGGWMWAQEGRGGHAGGGGVWRPGGRPCGPPPGLPNKRAGPGAKGPGPALSGRFSSRRGLQSSDSLSRYCANIAVRAAPAAGVELAVRVLPHSRCRAWFSPW